MTIPIIIGPNKTKNRSFRSRFSRRISGLIITQKFSQTKISSMKKLSSMKYSIENFNKKWFYVGFVLLCIAVVFL